MEEVSFRTYSSRPGTEHLPRYHFLIRGDEITFILKPEEGWPGLAVCTKRTHDNNINGEEVWTGLLTIPNDVRLVVLTADPGQTLADTIGTFRALALSTWTKVEPWPAALAEAAPETAAILCRREAELKALNDPSDS